MKNGKVTRFTLLELEINKHTEQINIVVTDLNSTDMFLGYDWLIKYNPEVNWNIGTIQFTRCLRECRIQHQNIFFISKIQKLQPMDNKDKG